MEKLIEKYKNMTKTQRNIIDYIMKNQRLVSSMSLKDISRFSGTSEATILKVCRMIGFNGFNELKKYIRDNDSLVSISVEETERLITEVKESTFEEKTIILQTIYSLLQKNIISMMDDLIDEQIFKYSKQIISSEKTFTFGHNMSKTLADYFSHRLNHLRIESYPIDLGDQNSVKLALTRMSDKDCIILFSFPPYNTSVLDVLNYSISKNLSPIIITDDINIYFDSSKVSMIQCPTQFPFFYNAFSTPMSLIEILSFSIAIELRDNINTINKEEKLLNELVNYI